LQRATSKKTVLEQDAMQVLPAEQKLPTALDDTSMEELPAGKPVPKARDAGPVKTLLADLQESCSSAG
jgi:hypothetical protein